jgi:hypothetical protein
VLAQVSASYIKIIAELISYLPRGSRCRRKCGP